MGLWASPSPRAHRGEDPCPPAPPGGREGLGTTDGLTAYPHRVQSLGKGSGQGVDGARGSYSGGADLPAPPSLALAVWFGAHHVSVVFKNSISCQRLQIGELHRKSGFPSCEKSPGSGGLGPMSPGAWCPWVVWLACRSWSRGWGPLGCSPQLAAFTFAAAPQSAAAASTPSGPGPVDTLPAVALPSL